MQRCWALITWNSDRGALTSCELLGSVGCQGPIHYQTNGPTANNTSLVLTATPRRNYCIFEHATGTRPETGCVLPSCQRQTESRMRLNMGS